MLNDVSLLPGLYGTNWCIVHILIDSLSCRQATRQVGEGVSIAKKKSSPVSSKKAKNSDAEDDDWEASNAVA